MHINRIVKAIGTLRSTTDYNKMGQITSQLDISELASGGNTSVQRSFERTVTYNAKGQITAENTYTIRD